VAGFSGSVILRGLDCASWSWPIGTRQRCSCSCREQGEGESGSERERGEKCPCPHLRPPVVTGHPLPATPSSIQRAEGEPRERTTKHKTPPLSLSSLLLLLWLWLALGQRPAPDRTPHNNNRQDPMAAPPRTPGNFGGGSTGPD
jgi:hypothetical protein